MDFTKIKDLADRVKENVGKVIVGKSQVIDLVLIALISSGHILLEDVPGMGKTLLAKSLAKSLDLDFKRVQFTPDLLPADITGLHYFNQKEGDFSFRKGPIFTNILLGDEINRATPRTQSSLLEAMEERQVTIDGKTFRLEEPFTVIATQNPVETRGTFPLPEAQLDRFLVKVSMGYPDKAEGLLILKRFKDQQPLESIEKQVTRDEIIWARRSYSSVYVCDDILAYIMDIVDATRDHPDLALGVSPRGSQALLKAAQAYAVIEGRSYVSPDDIKRLAKPVLAHRVMLRSTIRAKEGQADKIIGQILEQIRVPAEETLMPTDQRTKEKGLI
ncbi:MAG: MoxR family ATPase [Caldicoprobacterales bacterium]|jgi:MoxR-like ATPase|nr:MoxR family ATPase [Clostridia bacterium]MDI9513337.1 MoxR family ATPase [Bacillota bacterium]NLH59152.1 MoxR family ATPase [Clostridiales bacterium]